MEQMSGMDIAQVRQLSSQMDKKAAEINQLIVQLTAALQAAEWVGPDREAFLSEWSSRHAAGLKQMTGSLEKAARAAAQHANDQEAASRGW